MMDKSLVFCAIAACFVTSSWGNDEREELLLVLDEWESLELSRDDAERFLWLYGRQAALGGWQDMVERFIQLGARLDDVIWSAAKGGHAALVQQLLRKGASVHTALSGAAYGGHLEMAKILLEHGADPQEGVYGAAAGGHVELVKSLLARGGNPESGLSPAAVAGHTEVFGLLVEYGAVPDFEELCHASRLGKKEMLELILSQPGIQVNQRDSNNYTPLDLAEKNGHTDCAELLRAAGARRGYEW